VDLFGASHRIPFGTSAASAKLKFKRTRKGDGTTNHSYSRESQERNLSRRSDVCSHLAADVINKTGRFLDPIIAVVASKGGFWTPNGRHRLEAMRRLGAKSITALVVADREVAWQILALNTEKAQNLKERSLEVIRI
jgi:hypothetical protein